MARAPSETRDEESGIAARASREPSGETGRASGTLRVVCGAQRFCEITPARHTHTTHKIPNRQKKIVAVSCRTRIVHRPQRASHLSLSASSYSPKASSRLLDALLPSPPLSPSAAPRAPCVRALPGRRRHPTPKSSRDTPSLIRARTTRPDRGSRRAAAGS